MAGKYPLAGIGFHQTGQDHHPGFRRQRLDLSDQGPIQRLRQPANGRAGAVAGKIHFRKAHQPGALVFGPTHPGGHPVEIRLQASQRGFRNYGGNAQIRGH